MTETRSPALLHLAARRVQLDSDGFLEDFDAWDREVATAIAALEGIELTSAHWEILTLLRQFYADYQQSPAMRALVKYTAQRLDSDKGTSRYLLGLFPGSPARRASRIAGLPRPEHCL